MKLLGDQGFVMAQPAGEEIYRTLRRLILAGELPRDEHLVERRLAQQLNVSRTPVREALRKLEAEGLVRRAPYRGLVVTSLTVEDVEEIYRLREVLEGLAANLAAGRRPRSHLKLLRSLLPKIEKAFADNDPEGFGQVHIQFHDTLALASGSPKLHSLLATLRDYLASAALGYAHLGRSRQACEEHRAIVHHIASGNAAAAEEAARLHIRHSKDALLAVLATQRADRP